MLKKGHSLTDEEIRRGYDNLQPANAMPDYFYDAIVQDIGYIGECRLLDVGCGNGFLLRKIRRSNPRAVLSGLDTSQAHLAHARTIVTAPSQMSLGDSSTSLPFLDESFDVIVMSEVIEHLKDPANCIREVRRVLRCDGRFVMTAPNGSAWGPTMPIGERIPEGRLRNLMLPHEHPLKSPQPIDTVFTWDEIRSLLQGNGFAIVRVQGWDSFPYFFESIPAVPLVGMPFARGPWMRRVRGAVDRAVLAAGQTRLCYRAVFECRPVKLG